LAQKASGGHAAKLMQIAMWVAEEALVTRIAIVTMDARPTSAEIQTTLSLASTRGWRARLTQIATGTANQLATHIAIVTMGALPTP